MLNILENISIEDRQRIYLKDDDYTSYILIKLPDRNTIVAKLRYPMDLLLVKAKSNQLVIKGYELKSLLLPCNIDEKLPYDFDLLFDVKTYNDLLNYISNDMPLITQCKDFSMDYYNDMLRSHGLDKFVITII